MTTSAWVICDSDSYLKWGAIRASEMRGAGFDVRLYVVDNAVAPSAAQVEAAVAGTDETPMSVSFAELAASLPTQSPDVLLLASRGPMLELIVELLSHRDDRPVVAAGIPGIWMPPTLKGLRYRRGVDVLILHSTREEAKAKEMLPFGRIERTGIASLVSGGSTPPGRYRDHVVFAPQALVPRELSERLQVLRALVEVARRHPQTPVVVKLRGKADEAQTHAESMPYPGLARDHGIDIPGNLVFDYGSLGEYLDSCRGLVTVSSTAVLEAVHAGVPVLCIDDFGVSPANINTVFEGSGMLGSLAHLERLEFPHPDPAWLAANYLHEDQVNTWLAVVRDAVAARSRGELSTVKATRDGGLTGALRRVRDRSIALGTTDTWLRRAVATLLRPVDRSWRRLRRR